MIRCAALALLALAACSPEAKPPETPVQPAQVERSAPASTELAADEIPAPAGEITVTTPVAGAKVTSPLTVEGVASNTWFFEGQFPAELVVGGEALVVGPSMQQEPDNWTNPGPVHFKATLTFDVKQETSAVLILREDMPKPVKEGSDEPGPARTFRIPVTLMPPAQ